MKEVLRMVGYNERLWGFSPLTSIQESNFDKMLERFYGLGITGLTKENIQNSLDGRLKNSRLPVVVKITTGEVAVSNIPGIQTVHEHIKSLKGRNSYTTETIEHMVKYMQQEVVRYITFEDENTRGLSGAKNGQSNAKEDTWGIYAYNKGFHFEEQEEELETTRGGSHGVGKIASNAASDLHVMYFANCDENGEKHLGGTVQLIEHEYEEQFYRSTGYFAQRKQEGQREKFYPYENDFDSIFQKNTRGLKIIIPYLRESYDDEVEIIRTICDNFFVSILEGRLEIFVNEHLLTKETLREYLTNSQYYTQEISEMKKVFTPLYVQTYVEKEPHIITVNNSQEDFEFKLYFTYDEQIPKGRVGIVRTIGMKIEDFKVTANASKPFNAVLIGGLKEDKYLKSLENESHTQISFEHIKDKKLQAQAKRFINNLSKEVAAIIEMEMRKSNPVDAEMDTADLIYVMESQFKTDLQQAVGTVNVKDGKTLLKVTTGEGAKGKRKSKGETAEGPKTTRKRPEIRLVPKEKQPGKKEVETEEDEAKESFRVNPNTVERIVLKGQEHMQFTFSESKKMKTSKFCNISMRIIDGMGEETDSDFELHTSYERATDLFEGKECAIIDNKIKNVPIKKGQIKLKMDLREDFNRALKFIYYVEV